MHISNFAYIKILLKRVGEHKFSCVCVTEKTSEAGNVINEGLDLQNSNKKKKISLKKMNYCIWKKGMEAWKFKWGAPEEAVEGRETQV